MGFFYSVLIILLLSMQGLKAETVRVAVAANFYLPMQHISALFEAQTNHEVELSAASTGALYAQITQGAPYDLFLAADQQRPALLESKHLIVEQSRFTYAKGRLVFWSPKADVIDAQASKLVNGELPLIAIANPKTAPYGQAAVEVLTRLGLLEQYQGKLVEGQNLSQTYQYLISGTVPAGFLSLSQVLEDGDIPYGSAWLVPESMYQPIKQDAVLLKGGQVKGAQANEAAEQLWQFLQTDQIRQLIQDFGYQL
ncbi:molybdate ABC transporter substrate-binding protein [Reinekea thalattae]|uniref:Molybdate ABC transporter substrate-binding protein n=1 Tax=Reinekea thalattae TaxID=2593301 RepID=A0A5C8ZB25_9GAMM|nr:molybdate ABC transporter substrate-binding protein [Reinekea thalattae]TXR54479.1 molybdate ABC transporter substrate-binding protein [Reinekea thalattae]